MDATLSNGHPAPGKVQTEKASAFSFFMQKCGITAKINKEGITMSITEKLINNIKRNYDGTISRTIEIINTAGDIAEVKVYPC